MSTSARNAILGRLRRAERTGTVPAGVREGAPATMAVSADDLLQRFAAECEALGVKAVVEAEEHAVRARVADIVAGRSVMRWESIHIPYGVGGLFPTAATGASPRAEQASAAVGITGVDAAIAETGTLALLSGEGKPRAASLLPPTHVAVVRRGDICASMGEFFARSAEAISGAACCTLITGPSRTADIELTLTVGVHGPGVVIVVIGP
jgi:L-lactate dehydrogenase complex protein LldG